LKRLVAHAVQVEPVSTSEFPANREINREFRRIRLLDCDLESRHASKFKGLQRNSLLNRTGNFCEGTGNLQARTGITKEGHAAFMASRSVVAVSDAKEPQRLVLRLC